MGELVVALRANDPGAFRQWLSGGVQDLGEPVVEELLLDWLYSLLAEAEQDWLGLASGRELLINVCGIINHIWESLTFCFYYVCEDWVC